MKIDKKTGQQYCTTREELVKKYFITKPTEETYGHYCDLEEYSAGNKAIIELIERFWNDIRFGFTPEEMDYWKQVIRDIDGVMERDEKKRRIDMEPVKIRELRKYVEGDPWRALAVIEVLGWTAVKKLREEADERNAKVWLIIAGLMEDAHATVKEHICEAAMMPDEDKDEEIICEGERYEDIRSAINAIEDDLRERYSDTDAD